MLMMLAQPSTGLVETWYLARLGTQVFSVVVPVPVLMLMQNMSQGAMGGGISPSVARSLSSGNTALTSQLAPCRDAQRPDRHRILGNSAGDHAATVPDARRTRRGTPRHHHLWTHPV